MASILSGLWKGYDYVFNELSDPRTSAFPLMRTPFETLAILGFYLYFVKNLGPRLMEFVEPFKLKGIIMIYNVFQIFANLYIFYKSFELGWGGRYKLFCEPVDFSTSDHALSVAKLCYVFFWIKLLDLMDTVFFVFRKKCSQTTFLHVYHHTGMVVLVWSCVKFMPGGHGTSLGVINSFVHVVMYGYYLLTSINEKYKKSIWWKKHLTQLQIVQFVMLVLHFASVLIIPNCEYAWWIGLVIVPQNFFMLFLFLDFYFKTYVHKKSTKQTQ